MAESSTKEQQRIEYNDGAESNSDENVDEEIYDPCLSGEGSGEIISHGVPIDTIVNVSPQPPPIEDMQQIRDRNCIFMISPFKYDPENPEREPTPINPNNRYKDRWDENHVRMPCSPCNVNKKRQSTWLFFCHLLNNLKHMCDNNTATVEDLIRTIRHCSGRDYDMNCLEKLVNEHYSNDERTYFMSTVLSNICVLALNVDTICSQSLPLLRRDSNQSITISQRQVASLLACEFFCLFPYRSDRRDRHRFGKFPKLNFNRLYRSGHPKKIEKLKCILHYFRRITQKMPTGVITIQRVALPENRVPRWSDSKTKLCDLHITTGTRIEDINCVLQIDFAAKCIGGGVLGSGCVQEEIRFSICPEMLVSLIVCEVMEPNECIFLIGCEQYSSYQGYADSFQFAGDYVDQKPKDNWGRKWCHVVAMDAIHFRVPSSQYDMKFVDRELLKAYTGFRPLREEPEYQFGIATGNWGCGAFHGDKYVKAIIQWMAASEVHRPLIYASFRDTNLIHSFEVIYDYLKDQDVTVGDLYKYLQRYFTQTERGSFFEYILNTPKSFLSA